METSDVKSFMSSNNRCIVMFGARWCAPCKSAKPVIEVSGLPYLHIDVDDNSKLSNEFGVNSVPVIWLSSFNGGKVENHYGFNSEIGKRIKEFSKR